MLFCKSRSHCFQFVFGWRFWLFFVVVLDRMQGKRLATPRWCRRPPLWSQSEGCKCVHVAHYAVTSRKSTRCTGVPTLGIWCPRHRTESSSSGTAIPPTRYHLFSVLFVRWLFCFCLQGSCDSVAIVVGDDVRIRPVWLFRGVRRSGQHMLDLQFEDERG